MMIPLGKEIFSELFTWRIISKLNDWPFQRVNSPFWEPVIRRLPGGVHCETKVEGVSQHQYDSPIEDITFMFHISQTITKTENWINEKISVPLNEVLSGSWPDKVDSSSWTTAPSSIRIYMAIIFPHFFLPTSKTILRPNKSYNCSIILIWTYTILFCT